MELRLAGVSKRYGRHLNVLGELSMTVQGGSLCGIVGENGSGKSTLAAALAGFIQPDRGELKLRIGPSAYNLGKARNLVAYIAQKPNIVGGLSVSSNIFFGNELHKWDGLSIDDARQAEIADVLQNLWFRTSARAQDRASSPQDVARVAIIRALASGRPILVVDEATAYLESADRLALLRLLRQYADRGRIVLLISHNFTEVEEYCDTAFALVGGKAWPVAPLTRPALERVVFGPGGVPSLSRVDPTQSGPLLLHAEGKGWDFDVHSSEVVAVLGLADEGLEELFWNIAGCGRQSSGAKIVFKNQDLSGRSVRFRRELGLSFVPPSRLDHGLLPSLSCEQNLSLNPVLFHRASRLRRIRESRGILSAFKIPKDPTSPVGELSGGNQQRLLIAREVSGLPKDGCVVAFNPCTGIDAAARIFVLDALRQVKSRGGATLLISSEPDDAISVADVIFILSRGKIVAMQRAPFVRSELLDRMACGDLQEIQPAGVAV